MRVTALSILLASSLYSHAAHPTAGPSMRLMVDLSDASRNIFHAVLTVPAAPGEMTLVYPQWIPGNHRPSGPIANLTGLHFTARGQELAWHRDPADMYAFHVTVPSGTKEVQASFDLISTDSAGGGGKAASSNLLDSMPVYTNTAPDSPLNFIDIDAARFRQRFYRAVMKP